MNYGKLTAGTTKTAIDTAKPSEKGEIITYLSRMGDVLEQVADRSKLIFALCRVDVIRNGHQTNIMVREKFLCQTSDLNVVAPQAREVFDKDSGGFSLFQLADHFHEAGAIHRHAGNTVIQEMNQICVALFLCDFGKQLLLRWNLSRGFYAKKHDFIKMIQIHIIQTELRE